jgi:biopolymer transport protein ExbD
MSTGDSGGGLQNEINVTPMIDVLLVLLVIFMMAVPATRKAIDVQIPDPTPKTVTNASQTDQIVLQVLPGGEYKINSEEVPKDRLAARLKEIYDPRPDKIIFIKGDPKVTYQDVIHAMDVSRGAGVRVIGLPPL